LFHNAEKKKNHSTPPLRAAGSVYYHSKHHGMVERVTDS